MVGLVHAIGHACGGVCHVPHGDAMTILLPYCMEYNMDKISDLYGELLLPLAGPEVFAATPKENRGRKSVEVIRDMTTKFNKFCGLPIRLRDVKVKEEDLDKIAKTALNDGAIIVNPVDAGYEDIIKILRAAL